ncbi:MAG: ABC transporter permease [Candidatus Bathyarchaeota archaeon]|nr:ABC transporter permease [Candidatus Bathyarchaeota archaeon]
MTVQTILKHSYRIAQKDLMELFRNRLGLVLLIVMPLFMMVMVGFIYPTNGTISDLQIGVVNEDAGLQGQFMSNQVFLPALQGINDQTHMLVMSNISSVDDLKDRVQRGNLEGGIVIPANFSESLMSGQQGTIIIVSDESNPQISATIRSALTGVFDAIGTQFAEQQLNTTNIAVVKPFNIQTQGVVSGNPSYFDFIAPGIMAMTVMMSVMTGLPVAISQEKEIGTMDGMMVAPVNRLSILLGKTFAQTARGLIQGAIILALAIGIFGVTIQGSILLVFALLLLGVFSFVGLGIVITSFTKDQETAQMLMMTLMFPMMFLSGVFFPIQQMPWYMQTISQFLPLTYASDALRKVMVLGAGVPQITNELIILVAFGIVMIAIALPVFRRMMTR